MYNQYLLTTLYGGAETAGLYAKKLLRVFHDDGFIFHVGLRPKKREQE